MGDLPGPGLGPVSPALAGRFLNTTPPGKPNRSFLNSITYHVILGTKWCVVKILPPLSCSVSPEVITVTSFLCVIPRMFCTHTNILFSLHQKGTLVCTLFCTLVLFVNISQIFFLFLFSIYGISLLFLDYIVFHCNDVP